MSPAELKIYEHAKTVLDWKPDQIRKAFFLRGLHPAKNQDKLPGILARTGQAAMAAFADFRQVECNEVVSSEMRHSNAYFRFGPFAKVYHFHYIIIPKRLSYTVAFNEYRTDMLGKPVDLSHEAGLKMITSDFTSAWLYLSPLAQKRSGFRLLGTQKIDKHQCLVVGFAQDPRKVRSVSGFRVGKRTAALLVQGVAWINERSFLIQRVHTWLLAPRPDLGLYVERSTADYFGVRPKGVTKTLWVPHKVTVFVHYRGALLLNTHLYSNYKLFRVESAIKPAP